MTGARDHVRAAVEAFPVDLRRPPHGYRADPPVCRNPGCGRTDLRAKGRCTACYEYRRRTGHDRPGEAA